MLKVIVAGLIALSCLVSPAIEQNAEAQTRVIVVHRRWTPPPMRVERVVVRSGYIWAHGHWRWNGESFVWVSGHYIPIVYGRTWIHHRYILRGDYWVFVPGHWTR